MKTLRFKTTVKDLKDLESLKADLKNIEGIKECGCEDNDPGKAFYVKADGLTRDAVSQAIFKAGFRNEPLTSGWKKAAGRLFKKDCCK